MKLIEQRRLYYQEGSSDKVYEADLCEVGPGRYVVNYRYGRRGATLREGAETEHPVAEDEARRIFVKLVESKIKKGYREVSGAAAPAPAPAGPPAAAPSRPARDLREALLRRLQRGATEPLPALTGSDSGRSSFRAAPRRRRGRAPWSLERVLWRVGELGLPEAVPLLLPLLRDGGGSSAALALREHCALFALSRCALKTVPGSPERSLAEGALQRVLARPNLRPPARRMAIEGMRLLASPEARAEMARDLAQSLPPELRGPLVDRDAAALHQALTRLLWEGADADRGVVLETLYMIDDEVTRPALLRFLRVIPLRPPLFQRLRHLFKAAEVRRDGELFGLLSYRFEKSPPLFARSHWSYRVAATGESLSSDEIKRRLASARSNLAFGADTRTYLRRRSWRTLRNLGRHGDPDYVKMAVGVLLPFTDSDAGRAQSRGRNGGWDAFASYWAFNHILYGNSPRFKPQDNGRAFRRVRGDNPSGIREESFPLLWEQIPAGLLHLLSESACAPVHEFAVKALRVCGGFLKVLDAEAVLMLLGSGYPVTAELGFELAHERYRPDAPDLALLAGMADCAYAPGRAQARAWIDEQRHRFQGEYSLLARLVASPQADTRAYARGLLRALPVPEEGARLIIARVVAALMALGTGAEDRARDIAETLQLCCSEALRRIGLAVVQDLLSHPLLPVQEFAGQILLNHASPISELPGALLQRLLVAEHESLRGLGVALLGRLPDEALLRREDLLLTLATHPLADMRYASRPLLRRLAQGHPLFCEQFAAALRRSLLQREQAEGVHRHLLALLREDLAEALQSVGLDEALALCAGPSAQAQELGGLLLQREPAWALELPTSQVVKLASHEVLAVRAGCYAMMPRLLPRLLGDEAELGQAARILDSRWNDARAFGFSFFREHVTRFSPALLIGICDSVRPDVQAFGRELITRHFQDVDGAEYLLKLSEHPSTDLQLFATNYLERFAAGHRERIAALLPYFLSVLTRVNRGGVAKRRVHRFLQEQALQDEEVARLVSTVLGRQSATMAVMDRERCLLTLVRIHQRYPALALPIQRKAPALREASRAV